jgi:hypothetical protein
MGEVCRARDTKLHREVAWKILPETQLPPAQRRQPVRMIDPADFFVGVPGRPYDIPADGRRFLMIKDEATSSGIAVINVALNWTGELERLVPID